MTVVVSIGNSDDKLSQLEWRDFCVDVGRVLQRATEQIHGVWFSEPVSPYQNAAWCFDPPEQLVPGLKDDLARLAQKHRQASIAWIEGTPEFLS